MMVNGQNGKAQKFVIKSFANKPKIPENFQENAWNTLATAVNHILLQQLNTPSSIPSNKFSLEHLYKLVQLLCSYNFQQSTYTKLEQVLLKNVQEHVLPSILAAAASRVSDLDFLEVLDRKWKAHSTQIIMIRSIFLYLDRTFVLQTNGYLSLWDLGLAIFRENLLFNPAIKELTITDILAQIDKERNGDKIPKDLLKSLLRMYQDVGIYITAFEIPFIANSKKYYGDASKSMITKFDEDNRNGGAQVAAYLKYVSNRLKQEIDRCSVTVGYLDSGSKRGIVEVLDVELIKNHVDVLLEKGFDDLMDEEKLAELKQLYAFLDKVDEIPKLVAAFSNYILKTGESIVMDEAKDPLMITSLVNFKQKLDKAVQTSFTPPPIPSTHSSKNPSIPTKFLDTLKINFETFINKRPNKPAELIAKTVDSLLRANRSSPIMKTLNLVGDDAIEDYLNKLLTLFRFIQGKDIFEGFYKKDLAKRLLLGKSTNSDTEKNMLLKMRNECGAGFTSKLEGMFKDTEISKDLLSLYRQSPVRPRNNLDFNVQVLTSGFWPTYPVVDIQLSEDLATEEDAFKKFYLSKHSGRRLTWLHSLTGCVLKCDFPSGTKEISLTLYQALIMLLFNTQQTLTYTQIAEQTSIPQVDLIRVLQSLSCAKLEVLNKTTPGSKWKKTVNTALDTFSVNEEFSSPLFRFKIPMVQEKAVVEKEDTNVRVKVFSDRQYAVDAAIVRVMKTRKMLSHNLLISELIRMLDFNVEIPQLKVRIESLIELEYLERDSNDSSLYKYLA